MAKVKARSRNRSTSPARRNRVRSAARGPSASPAVRQLFQLDEAALAAIGLSRNEIATAAPPTVAFHFSLVEHGYELHLFANGQYLGASCRDFSGNHKIKELKASLISAVSQAIIDWRAKL